MIQIRKILCPIDFSTQSRQAFDHAMAIAHRYESTTTVIYVLPRHEAVVSAEGLPVLDPLDLIRADRGQVLRDVARFVNQEGVAGAGVHIALKEGPPAAKIVAEAAAMPADLIVMGTHGRTGFDRLLLGSVAERVLRSAPCPVLTIPPAHPDVVPASPVLFKNVLCAVDFSPCSMHALNYAALLAQEADATLTVANILPRDFEPLAARPLAGVPDDRFRITDYLMWREEETERLLAGAVPKSTSTYCKVETKVLHGHAGKQIIAFATEHACDLIVLGVQGRSAVDLAIFGSTAQHVVRNALCPVLTVPATTAVSRA